MIVGVMDENGPADTTAATSLPATMELGPAELVVRDLDRSIAFYEDVVGLDLAWREDARAGLRAGQAHDVLLLREQPDAEPPGRRSGLYHVALLYPSRLELAHAIKRIIAAEVPIDGVADHKTHEAVYLPDPDGNGLELAADLPREQWPDYRHDALLMGPHPLDVRSLLDLAGDAPPPPRADSRLTVGHLHLHVGDIDAALAFYRDLIGLELQASLDSAAFVSAGGYHHHLAFNIWKGRDVRPWEAGLVGLHRWTIALPSVTDVDAVRERLEAAGHASTLIDGGFSVPDPWNITLHVVAFSD